VESKKKLNHIYNYTFVWILSIHTNKVESDLIQIGPINKINLIMNSVSIVICFILLRKMLNSAPGALVKETIYSKSILKFV
jgi:hypothetical protein